MQSEVGKPWGRTPFSAIFFRAPRPSAPGTLAGDSPNQTLQSTFWYAEGLGLYKYNLPITGKIEVMGHDF